MEIILTSFMSLDGVVQAPGGPEEDTDGGFAHGGWSHKYFDPETMGSAWDAVIRRSDALLFGRRTWQGMAAAWPERAGDPFADLMNEIPKYVASRTLGEDDLTWSGSTLLPADDAIGAVRELRERDGQGLQVMGSASLATQLVEVAAYGGDVTIASTSPGGSAFNCVASSWATNGAAGAGDGSSWANAVNRAARSSAR